MTNQSGSIRLLDVETLERVIPEKKGKSVTTLSKEKLLPSSAKANSSATSRCITYQRNLKGASRSKLGSSEIHIKTDMQGYFIYIFLVG